MKRPHNSHDMDPHQPTDRTKPAGKAGHHDAGPERKADVRGAMEGGSKAEGSKSAPGVSGHIGHAVKELHKQHPHHHSAGGIHGTSDHVRHERGKF